MRGGVERRPRTLLTIILRAGETYSTYFAALFRCNCCATGVPFGPSLDQDCSTGNGTLRATPTWPHGVLIQSATTLPMVHARDATRARHSVRLVIFRTIGM